MSEGETRQIRQPIFYDDGQVTHARESGSIAPGVRTVWTKCDIDVPDDQSFTVEGDPPAITCPECWAAIG